MKQSFNPFQARACLLLALAAYLYAGSAAAQRISAGKSAAEGYAQLVAQIGHEQEVEGIAFSPDGKLLLTASGDAAVLWEVSTGQELRRFLGRITQSEPFSTDVRYLMTAFEQYTGYGDFSSGWFTTQGEHLFDVTTGKEITFTAADAKGFWAVVISPDNRLVATADQRTDMVRIWDVATRRQLKQFKPFVKKHEVKGIGFTKDGRFLLTTIEDEKEPLVQLWEPTTGQETHRFAGKLVRESSDSRFLVTQAGQVGHLWQRETSREIKRLGPLPGADSLIGSSEDWHAVFSSDSRLVAISPGAHDEERMVRVYESINGKELHSFTGSAPAFSPDGRYIITITGSRPPQLTFKNDTAHVWDISTGEERRRFPAEAAKFSPDNRYVVTLNPYRYEKNKKPARLWEIATGEEVLRFEGYPNGVQVARFSPDGRLLATAGGDEHEVRLWDIAARREVRRFAGNFLSGNFEVSRDNRFMMTKTSRVESHVVAGSDEEEYELRWSVQLWDLSAGLELRRFESRRTGDDIFTRENEAAFSPASGSVVVNEVGAVSLRDPTTGQEIKRFQGTDPLFVPGGRLLTTHDKKQMYLWNVATGREARRFPVQAKPGDDSNAERFIAFSPDGRYGITMGGVDGVTVTSGTSPRLWDLTTGKLLRSLEDMMYNSATFSPDSRSVLLGTGLAGDGGGVGLVCLFSVPAGAELRCFAGREAESSETANYGITALEFSPDGRFVLAANTGGTAHLWNARTGRQVHRFPGNNARISPDGRFVLTSDKNNARLWDAATGKQLHRFEHPSEVGSIDFMSDGRIALTASGDSSLRLWNTATGQELCRLVSFKDNDWVVIAPDGRFDTNNLDEIKGLHWITSDAPFTTLPLEIFMRQYYEPRLLPRIILGEKFDEVPPLVNLNRVQPKVEIKEISTPDEQGRVSITVKVARARSETQRDSRGDLLETGVYDLRLFRDGQLVGYEPKEGREVRLDSDGTRTISFENVRLPRKPGVKSVEFSAYAFNVAQVKSTTARRSVEIPDNLQPLKGRAYIVTVGINAYENKALDLSFAANDAHRLQDVMHKSLTGSGEYVTKDIVQIPLISDYKMDGGRSVVSPNNATKRVFKAVLDLLSGKNVDDPELRKQIPNIDQIRAARPEDLVLISFSSHGYADQRGNFYFITSDTGPGTDKKPTPELLKHAVSSDELSLWLRDLDAGEMVLIVDACQSTAAVAAAGFKPGPMDSRGLGQLSYDKGMKILTATQSDSVALESKLIKQGLLTYALVHDGIEAEQADFKPRDKSITLSEWLAYGVNRVPELYEELKQDRVQTFGSAISEQAAKPVMILSGSNKEPGARILEEVSVEPLTIQQPSLFDFTKKRRDIVLVRK